jgi:nucleoside-diphosphate-sugar epimerase
MKILITGARGFVGNFMANHLKEKHILLTPNSQDLNLTNLTQVKSWFENNQVDAIVHCALSGREILSSTDPQYLSDGLLMFRNLWLHRDQYKRFINLGTAYEFDHSKNNFNVKEHEFIDHLPTTSYGYSKNVIARIIRDTPKFYNLRLFGVFHETESPLRFFKRVVNQDQIVINNDQLLSS